MPMRSGTLPALDSLAAGDASAARSPAGRIAVHLAEDGIVEVTLPPNGIVRVQEARAAAATVRAMAAGRRLPVLLTVTGVQSVTNEARQTYSDSVAVSAFALLGESPVDRVIAHYLLRVKSDSIPARFFTSGLEAREWLGRYHLET